jgi:predicted transcriptional regulator YdeE
MASRISRLTFLLKKNRVDEIQRELSLLKEEQSTSITISGAKSKVIGLTMHVSKAKKMHVSAVSKGVGDKRLKRELTYHRLVFCRYVFTHHVLNKQIIYCIAEREYNITMHHTDTSNEVKYPALNFA